jgi:thymidylate synthase (FAD)
MHTVKLQWATPNADQEIMYMARVSNPKNQNSGNDKLLYYCMKNGHVSPFEMASACVEINTTRDIGRQILRHKSFSFQEMSQRYLDVKEQLVPESCFRECRLQDTKNRQNSIELSDESKWLSDEWDNKQKEIIESARNLYNWAINNGIAKEQARAILPEGLTTTKMYMSGNMRSWIFYLKQRLDPSTQKEHRAIASECLKIMRIVAPITMIAFFGEDNESP